MKLQFSGTGLFPGELIIKDFRYFRSLFIIYHEKLLLPLMFVLREFSEVKSRY